MHVREMEAEAEEAGCKGHLWNDRVGGMQQGRGGKVDSGANKARRHDDRVIRGRRGNNVADEHGWKCCKGAWDGRRGDQDMSMMAGQIVRTQGMSVGGLDWR